MDPLAQAKAIDLSARFRRRHSSSSFEPQGKPFRQSGRTDFLRGRSIVVRNAEESEPGPLKVGERVAGRVAAVARLTSGANYCKPLSIFASRDRCSRHRLERHWPTSGPDVVKLLFVHVAAENDAGCRGSDALFRLSRTGDIDPLVRGDRAGMHEHDVVIPHDERQTRQERALLFAELALCPIDSNRRAHAERDIAAERRGIMVAEHDHCALGSMLRNQVKHSHGISPVAHEIAQERVTLRAERLGVIEASRDCFEIAVNVREQCKLHDARPSVTNRRSRRAGMSYPCLIAIVFSVVNPSSASNPFSRP